MKDNLQPSLEQMAQMGLDVQGKVEGVGSISYEKKPGEYVYIPVVKTLWISDYSGSVVEQHTVFVPDKRSLMEMKVDMGV